jgi:esterase
MSLYFKQQGQGPALVILHGLFGSGDNWNTVAKVLANDFTVYTVDLPNHGRSDHTEQMNYPAMAEEVAEFMDQLGLAQAMVMGHSMGGKVAMQLALSDPDRISRLIVVDISPKAYQHRHTGIFETLCALDLATLEGRKQAEEHLAQGIENPMVVQFLLKSLYRNDQGQYAWRFNLPVLQSHYPEIAAAPSAEDPYQGPTLFIKGANSDYIQAEDQPVIARLFPNAQAKIIADTGHWPHAEKGRLFLKQVTDFLNQP